jgi:FkbM family methyltransferase
VNPLRSLRRAVPEPIKRLARRLTRDARLARALTPYLPELVCVDVGASYFPHAKWRLFLQSARTHWIAVEPNQDNLGYTKSWAWPSRISCRTTGLSREGGRQTLYVTNVDSGSSLLEPVVSESMSRRMLHLDYLFPVRTREIETVTLAQVLDGVDPGAPSFVKLDTQGTELSILSGAEQLIRSRRIMGIELEATLLAQPVMRGSGRFWQACQYLEDLGLELLQVHPIYGPTRFGVQRPRGVTYLNECDAVFAVRADIARTLSTEQRTGLLVFYLCNRLFEEALMLLADDGAVSTYLSGRGCDLQSLNKAIKALA